MPHIEPREIISSLRIPSGHGPNIQYELLHCIVNWQPDYSSPVEAVLVRMVYDGVPNHGMPAEIPMRDLETFQREWNNFAAAALSNWQHRNPR